MDNYHKYTLTHFQKYLRENLCPKNVYPYLIEKGILTADVVKKLESLNEDEKQVDELIKHLLKGDSNAYLCFIDALSENDPWIVEELKKPSNIVLNGAKLNKVINFLIKQVTVVEKWKDLARELELEDRVYQIERKLLRFGNEDKEAIPEILHAWKGKKSHQATLLALMYIFEENLDLKDIADHLEKLEGLD